MSRRGFTLLEVMVAMSVLALGLVVAFEVVGGAIQNHLRARDLQLATLLARGKLADVQAKFDLDGFRDFDESEDGSFDAEGHPEVRWEMKAVKPTVDLGPEGVIKALTGADGGVQGLLGLAGGDKKDGAPSALSGLLGGAGGSSAQAADPKASATSALAGPAVALIQQQLTTLGEEIKKGVREIRLTVSWPDGSHTESLTVVTHLVILGSAQERAAGAAQQAVQGQLQQAIGQGLVPGGTAVPIQGNRNAAGGQK
jgi:general secretion pathway protein I